jgi:hypothetical protein
MSATNGASGGEPLRPKSWAALAGRWNFETETIVYEGPATPDATPYGLAVSDLRSRESDLEVGIQFSDLSEASAGLVLGFHSDRATYVIPQLGGYSEAYAIAAYDPGVAWRRLIAAGSIQNLRPGRVYRLSVAQRGQRIRMSVDEVQVFDHVLGSPLEGNQIGLYAWGTKRVDFSELTVRRGLPTAFVAMPFAEPFDALYRSVIEPACAGRFQLVRMDQRVGPGMVFEEMKREIEDANVVIAEITAANQNVFYEIGYAHALNKPTVFLAKRGTELPFDIRGYRVIFYDDSIGGKPVLDEQLAKHLQAILLHV